MKSLLAATVLLISLVGLLPSAQAQQAADEKYIAIYGVVQQGGGGLSVESEVRTGTTFRVYLPRVDCEQEEEEPLEREIVMSDHEIDAARSAAHISTAKSIR